MHILRNTALYNKQLIKLGFSATLLLYNVIKICIHHNKNPNLFALYIFGPKCCLRPARCIVEATQDDIYSKTIRF